MVALMSGVLSILRELTLIYFPNQVNQRPLFWHCVIIAFIVSMGIIWWQQSKVIETLTSELRIERAKNTPNFEIAHGTVVISDAVLDYGPQKEGATTVLLPTTVINHGAPSIVKTICLYFENIDGKQLSGQAYMPHQEQLKFQGPKGPISIPTASSLFSRATANPIPTGGQADGFVLFRFPGGLRQKMAEADALVLEITDHTNKKYTLRISRCDTPGTDFNSTPAMQPFI